MKKLKCHPTADEVYAQVSSEHPTISRGTVYRNLNQLMADGEIIGVALPGSAMPMISPSAISWLRFRYTVPRLMVGCSDETCAYTSSAVG